MTEQATTPMSQLAAPLILPAHSPSVTFPRNPFDTPSASRSTLSVQTSYFGPGTPITAANSDVHMVRSRTTSSERDGVNSEYSPRKGQGRGSETSDSGDSVMMMKTKTRQKPFKSMLMDPQGNSKPWLVGTHKRIKERPSYFVFLFWVLVGFGIGGYLIWDGYNSVPRTKFCEIFSEDFSSSTLNADYWTKETQMGGSNSGDFTLFTDSDTNSYIRDGQLHIVPSLTSDVDVSTLAFVNASMIDLGDKCTAVDPANCQISVAQNATLVVPPVMSASITTRNKINLKYGRVVVRVKMPTGDWIWPRISLVPANDVYGAYPRSGLIDLVGGRGNLATSRFQDLNNVYDSAISYGPGDIRRETDSVFRLYRNFFNEEFYTFGMDWDENEIITWIKTRAHTVMVQKSPKKGFFDIGNFPTRYGNGTFVENPWTGAVSHAPFDQKFYLRIQVAAGGIDGFWPDNSLKPWQNASPRQDAMRSFATKQSGWYDSWPKGDKIKNRALLVDSVKMYDVCN